ncbi:MAG: glycosyltransferase [Myxococcales bacterium]|nr:glycosyltransferase [Myxococcales bacterium]
MIDVSVLLPCRNARSTLEEALDSLLAQQHVRFEIMAVDDGSRDGSFELLSQCACRHRQLKLTRTPGVGIARALELARRQARAPLLARMDADDRCHPERLAQQAEAMGRDPSVAALGSCVEAFPEQALQDGMRHYLRWQHSLLTPDEHRDQLFVESPLCHPSVMLRQDALERVGGFRHGPFPEDYDLWLRLDGAGFGLAKLPATLLHWRHSPGSATWVDPRYDRERFTELKAPWLARRLRQLGQPVEIWGAGRTGKRLARALEPHGIGAERFIDIDPRKIGRQARGRAIVGVEALGAPGAATVVVAVGARGARDLVRAELSARGHREGRDFLCAS